MSSHFRMRRLQHEARLLIYSRSDHFKGITVSQVCKRVADHLSWSYAPTESPSRRQGSSNNYSRFCQCLLRMTVRGERQECQEHSTFEKRNVRSLSRTMGT